jgi:hypothetical protein
VRIVAKSEIKPWTFPTRFKKPTSLKGDARSTFLYDVPLGGPDEANAVLEALQNRCPTNEDIDIKWTNRPTIHRAGTCRHEGGRCVILLHQGGQNVGTLVHEYCHVGVPGQHGPEFRQRHSAVLAVVEEVFKPKA